MILGGGGKPFDRYTALTPALFQRERVRAAYLFTIFPPRHPADVQKQRVLLILYRFFAPPEENSLKFRGTGCNIYTDLAIPNNETIDASKVKRNLQGKRVA